MSIETYGAGGRIRYAAKFCAEDISLQKRHLILLPIPTTKDKKHINGTEIPLDETLAAARADTVVVGYGLPIWYRARVREAGAVLLDLSADEAFLTENAYITALGMLGRLLSDGVGTPTDTSFAIVGYGRIGKELLRLLLFLGARVRVYTSTEKTHIALGESGVDSCLVGGNDGCVCDFSGIQVLINTAPTDVLALLGIDRLPDGITAYELASGDNFGSQEVTRLPSLPEVMFPMSAGYSYFKGVKNFIQCEVD